MSWRFGGKAVDAGFAAEVARVFEAGEREQAGSPASVRAIRAVRGLVEQAPLNIPTGCVVAFATTGHLDGDGRGEVSVTVKIETPGAEGEERGKG